MLITIITILSCLINIIILSIIGYNGAYDYRIYKDIVNNSIRGRYYNNKLEEEIGKDLLIKLIIFIVLLLILVLILINYFRWLDTNGINIIRIW